MNSCGYWYNELVCFLFWRLSRFLILRNDFKRKLNFEKAKCIQNILSKKTKKPSTILSREIWRAHRGSIRSRRTSDWSREQMRRLFAKSTDIHDLMLVFVQSLYVRSPAGVFIKSLDVRDPTVVFIKSLDVPDPTGALLQLHREGGALFSFIPSSIQESSLIHGTIFCVSQIEWYHNGRLIRPSNRYDLKLTKDGVCSLCIRTALPEDAGHYTCCATNLIGRDTCSAELFIEGASIIDETSYVAPETLRRMMKRWVVCNLSFVAFYWLEVHVWWCLITTRRIFNVLFSSTSSDLMCFSVYKFMSDVFFQSWGTSSRVTRFGRRVREIFQTSFSEGSKWPRDSRRSNGSIRLRRQWPAEPGHVLVSRRSWSVRRPSPQDRHKWGGHQFTHFRRHVEIRQRVVHMCGQQCGRKRPVPSPTQRPSWVQSSMSQIDITSLISNRYNLSDLRSI